MTGWLPRKVAGWAIAIVLATMLFGGVAFAQSPATLSIAAQNTDGLVPENGGTATFEVTLTGDVTDENTAITVQCRVDFTREHSEASGRVDKDAGDDDSDSSNDHRRVVTITPSASRTGTCAFDMHDDTDLEPDKFLEVVLEEVTSSPFPTGVSIDADNSSATVTVTSDETGTFEIRMGRDALLWEDGSVASHTREIQGGYYLVNATGTDLSESFRFTWTIGGDVDAADFSRGQLSATGTLGEGPIRDGAGPSEPIGISIADDMEVEGTEMYTFSFVIPDQRWHRSLTFTTGPVGSGRILDNDTTEIELYLLSGGDSLVSREPNNHPDVLERGRLGSAYLIFNRARAEASTITFAVELSADASAADWTSEQLTPVSEGDGTHTVEVPATDLEFAINIAAMEDGIWEGGREETLTISVVTGALPTGITITTAANFQRATIRLVDSTLPPRVMWSATGGSPEPFAEGNAMYRNSLSATLPTERLAFTEDRTFTLAVSPNSDADLSDIVLDAPTMNTVDLAAGVRSIAATWTFGLVDDDIVEGPETLIFQPTVDGPGADEVEIPELAITGMLADNDTATVGFTSAADSAPVEEGGTPTLAVTITKAVAKDMAVPWTVTGVDAAELDSGMLTGTVMFTAIATQAGTLTQNIALTIADDSDPEGPETFTVTLSDPTGDLSALVSLDTENTTREVTIAVNDGAVVREVTGVAITSPAPESGFYGVGGTLVVTVTFDGTVTVTGTPTIDLLIGEQTHTVNYSGVTGSEVTGLTFDYSVVTGDEDHDGVSVVANSLSLGGADTILGPDDIPADLANTGVPDDTSHRVDARAPTITMLDVASEPIRGGTYGVRERIRVQVTFSEMVTVVGTPTLGLQIGDQVVQATLQTTAFPAGEVWFRHQVVAIDVDGNGLGIPQDPFTLETGETIQDAVGLDAVVTRAAVADLEDQRVDGTALAGIAADMNGDYVVEYGDAIILYSALQFTDLLGDGTDTAPLGTVDFRQTFIAPYVRNREDDAIKAVLRDVNLTKNADDPRHPILDVSGDGEVTAGDAAVMYYAWRLIELVGTGGDRRPTGIADIREDLVGVHFADATPEAVTTMIARAREVLLQSR